MRLVINDDKSGGWGHIGIDNIQYTRGAPSKIGGYPAGAPIWESPDPYVRAAGHDPLYNSYCKEWWEVDGPVKHGGDKEGTAL